jgi:Spy/CpxP family protein refolding chaperone
VAGFGITFTVRSASAQPRAVDRATEAVMDWLGVPAAQRDQFSRHDPQFAADLQRLRDALARGRAELAAALEDGASNDQQIRARSEAVIAASAALERRVTDYLLAIRRHLTPEQQKRLFGICAQGVRQGGGGQWRHGRDGDGPPPMGRGMGRGYRGGRGPAQPPATRPAQG